MFVRAKLKLSEKVADMDIWAINIIENNSISPILENGWWWCEWPNNVVELFFDISLDSDNSERYLNEVKHLISKGVNIVEETVTLNNQASLD